MKKHFENWLIKKLLADSGLKATDINTENRTVDLGLWSFVLCFFEPKHNLLLAMLVKWYGYKCYEQRMEIRSTFLGEETKTLI